MVVLRPSYLDLPTMLYHTINTHRLKSIAVKKTMGNVTGPAKPLSFSPAVTLFRFDRPAERTFTRILTQDAVRAPGRRTAHGSEIGIRVVACFDASCRFCCSFVL